MRGREAGLSIRPASLFRTSSLLQISVGKAALCLQRIVGVDGRSGLGGGNDVRSQKKSFPVPGRHDFRTTISEKSMLTLFGRPVFRKSVRRRSEADVRSGKAGERVAWRRSPSRLFCPTTGLFNKPEFIGGNCGCGGRKNGCSPSLMPFRYAWCCSGQPSFPERERTSASAQSGAFFLSKRLNSKTRQPPKRETGSSP